MPSLYIIYLAHQLKFTLKRKRPFTGRGVLLKWTDKFITRSIKPGIMKTLYGFKMKIDPIKDKGVERSIFLTGTYEAGTIYILKHILVRGDIYVDVGSNIGLMAIFAARRIGINGNVHCFEPEPETFKILQENCNINNVRNIRLNNTALGAENKKGIIYANFHINRGASSLVRSDGSQGKKVDIITLDQYVTIENIKNIKLVKIDIEGYELEMLKGARQLLQSENAPILCVEYSKDVVSTAAVEDVYDFIRNINSYKIYRFKGSKGDICGLQEVMDISQMPLHDNIFCFLPDHLASLNTAIFN